MSRLPTIIALLPLPYLLLLAASVTGVVTLPTETASDSGSFLAFLVVTLLLVLLTWLPLGGSRTRRVLGCTAYSLALFGGTGLGAVKGVLAYVGGLEGMGTRSLATALFHGAGAAVSSLGLLGTAGLLVQELRRDRP
jgi:DMSO/TMAO reductase YedYZ heme-binding membrane subunit